MPKLFLLCFIAIMPYFLWGQSQEQDIVYLKNGSVIRGEITEEKQNEYVKILVTETHELFFPMDEVKSISYKKEQEKAESCPKKDLAIYYKHKGLYVNVFGSYGFANASKAIHNDFLMTNTNIVVGYMFNRHIGVGVGTGSYWYHVSGRHAPFYLDVRGEFLKPKRLVPIYYGRVGYGVVIGTSGITTELKSGLFWNVGLGYKEYTTRKHQWTYTVGLQSQYTYQKWAEEKWTFDEVSNIWFTKVVNYEGVFHLRRIVWAWGIMF